MADNNQVWAVDTPGAPHSAALARQAAYATTGGVTGIVASSRPGVGVTPGTPMSVRLDPCSVVAASTYAGAYRETYSFNVDSSVDVAVEPTGTSSRTDVIAFVVTDPVLESRDILELDSNGEPVPGSTGIDPREHDYWEAMRFAGVPSSVRQSPEAFRQWAQGQSNIYGPVVPYAIVRQGANSSSLEGKVQPFYETVMGRRSSIIVDQPINRIYEESGAFSAYRTLGPALEFETPWWATRANVKATIQGFRAYRPGGGRRRGIANGLVFAKSMNEYWWDDRSESAWGRQLLNVWTSTTIPANHRGTTTNFRFRVTSRDAEATVQLDEMSHMFLEVEFIEDPQAVDNSEPGA